MKTIVLLLDNRKALELVENMTYSNIDELVKGLQECGMTEEEEETLGYYEISEYMDLVNDQVLDNLEDTFLGYVYFKN